MKRILSIIVLFVLIISLVKAIEIAVEVRGTILGKPGFFNYSKEAKNLAWFFVNWENTGSVSCRSRMRVDIYNDSEIIYTAWSKAEKIEPGGNADLKAYWYPYENGSYEAEIKIYQCNEIFEVRRVNFSSLIEKQEQLLGKVKIKNDENFVHITFEPEEPIKNLVGVVDYYPKGWIFDYYEVSDIEQGKKIELKIGYSTEVWKPRRIRIDLLADDGRKHMSYEYTLKEIGIWDKLRRNPWILISMISILINIYLIIKGKILLVLKKRKV